MIWTMRWYGPEDPVGLAALRQVPGLDGLVTALHDVPAGQPWTPEAIRARQELLAEHGFAWTVAESVPVSEAIKTDGPDRDAHVAAWAESVRNLGAAGVRTVCYNFMPVFDWMRTDFAMPLEDGSNAMAYVEADLARFDLSQGMERLAAWSHGYSGDELRAAFARYDAIDERRLHEHLAAFLHDVAPVAEAAGVRLAIHPDDPPWSIFGLPRIVKNGDDLARIVSATSSPANGVTFCTGALGADPENDLSALAERFADRVAFVHARNVRHTGPRAFREVAHHRSAGDVDLRALLHAFVMAGVSVPLRPDHGRALWGETGIPGYGLYDRAIGLAYLQGLHEALVAGAA